MGADVFKIKTAKNLTHDLNTPTTEAAKDEKNATTPLGTKNLSIKRRYRGYDTIFVGILIGEERPPMPVLSFLNFYNLSIKNIHTFCAAVSSSITGSTADIRSNANGGNVVEVNRFSHKDEGVGNSELLSLIRVSRLRSHTRHFDKSDHKPSLQ